jgi:predicted ATPase/DNA-binding winged helix-turn-helix (wHTH) protein
MKQFESFGLDTSNECLWQAGVQIALPPKPFAVLRHLVENPGRLITHDELLDALWPETYVQPQVLRTYMLDLRKVLGDDAKQPRFIQTVPKRGYCFVAVVTDRAGMERIPAPGSETHADLSQENRIPDGKSPAIVDRHDELARMNACAKLAAYGTRQVVFVSGETGIGKTALVDAFCRQMGSMFAANVARGQCVRGFGSKEQYYPVMEALSQICASPDGEIACTVLARMAPAWLATLGREPKAPAPAAARADAQVRMPGDLCAALEELAAEKPLILVFEDLHWADDSTLDLVSALARRRAPARLMVLATFRREVAAWEHPLKELKQDLLIRRLCTEIVLAPLARSALKELLSRELDQEALPPGLAAFVQQRSEGNPLFAIAIVEHLVAQRILVREGAGDAARWQQRAPFDESEAGVPDELAQMIELEIERLSPREQRILEAASLMNVAFPSWAVAAAVEEDVAHAEEACDELARRLHFVHRAGQDELPDGNRSAFYVFAHELYREVLNRRQPATRRSAMHIRIAGRLGELFAGRAANVATEMAMHYEAAGDWMRAARALRAAAEHARQRNADAEADQLLEHALQLAENLHEHVRASVVREVRDDMSAARESSTGGAAPKKKLDEFWMGT